MEAELLPNAVLLGFGLGLGALVGRLFPRAPACCPSATRCAALREMPVPVAIFSLEGRNLLWNPAMEALTGIPGDRVQDCFPAEIAALGPGHPITLGIRDVVGTPSRDDPPPPRAGVPGGSTPPDPLPDGSPREAWREPFRTRVFSARSQQQVPVLATLSLLRPDPAADHVVMLALADLSESETWRLAHQKALAEAESNLRKLSEVDRMKSEFLAICSHELRTPLVSITGYLDLLSSRKLGPLNDRQVNALEVSLRNAARLKELLSSLLDLARLEAGKMQYEFTPQRLPAMVEELIAIVHPMAGAKGLNLRMDFPPDLPMVSVDASLLHRALLNLLDNAIKFTPPGGSITVRGQAGNDRVELEILDTGVGIRPEDIQRVTEPFFQSDASDTRSTGGLGLGLAIVEKILIGHGTRLSIASETGKWTRVWFSLREARKSPSGRLLAGAPGPGAAPGSAPVDPPKV